MGEKRVVVQDRTVPVWRHEVWWDGLCGGVAFGAGLTLLAVWIVR